MPRQDAQGRWISEDCSWWWDGTAWRPVGSKAGRNLGLAVLVLFGLGLVVAVGFALAQPPTYNATLSYSAGSDLVSGTATNRSSTGCSHFTVHIKFLDHNDALVGDEQDPDIGEVAANASRPWSYHLTSLGFVPYDVPDSVTSATIEASCEDQH